MGWGERESAASARDDPSLAWFAGGGRVRERG